VNEDKVEGVAIANLIAVDENNIVGWVYRWNTGVRVPGSSDHRFR